MHEVALIADGAAALEAVHIGRFEVLAATGGEGVSLIAQPRQSRIEIAALILNALGTVTDRVAGLDPGGSDCAASKPMFTILWRKIDLDGITTVREPESTVSRRLLPSADEQLVRRTAWRVGWWITAATAPLVIVVMVADAFDELRTFLAIDGCGSARTGFGLGLALVQDTATRFGGSADRRESSARISPARASCSVFPVPGEGRMGG